METKNLNLEEMEELNGGKFDQAFWCSTGGAILWGAAAAGGPTPVAVAGLIGAVAVSIACEAAYG